MPGTYDFAVGSIQYRNQYLQTNKRYGLAAKIVDLFWQGLAATVIKELSPITMSMLQQQEVYKAALEFVRDELTNAVHIPANPDLMKQVEHILKPKTAIIKGREAAIRGNCGQFYICVIDGGPNTHLSHNGEWGRAYFDHETKAFLWSTAEEAREALYKFADSPSCIIPQGSGWWQNEQGVKVLIKSDPMRIAVTNSPTTVNYCYKNFGSLAKYGPWTEVSTNDIPETAAQVGEECHRRQGEGTPQHELDRRSGHEHMGG